MGDVPELPKTLVGVVGQIVVPLVMLWLLLRWFVLVRDDGKHPNALEATRKGSAAGAGLAVVLLLGYIRFVHIPISCVDKLAWVSVALAVIAGIVTTVVIRQVPARLAPGSDDSTGWPRGVVVCLATAGSLVAIVLYYSYPVESPVRQWLMWAFVGQLFWYRFSLLFGGKS